MKTRQNNDGINRISVVYTKTEIELSRPIEPGVICYQNWIGQRHDHLYKYSLHKKKTKLSYRDQLD